MGLLLQTWEGSWLYSLELLDPLHHLSVLIVTEVVIVSSKVPWVEGVVTNTVECLLWKSGLILYQDLIKVLIMAKGHLYHVQPTVGFINTILCAAMDTGSFIMTL